MDPERLLFKELLFKEARAEKRTDKRSARLGAEQEADRVAAA
jgi:hypothetical protein